MKTGEEWNGVILFLTLLRNDDEVVLCKGLKKGSAHEPIFQPYSSWFFPR